MNVSTVVSIAVIDVSFSEMAKNKRAGFAR